MKETYRTAAFAVVALGLLVAAFKVAPREARVTLFDDQGTPFYAAFDPEQCTSVEVVRYDETKDEVKPFKVHFRNGKWTIPSHEDYPADAKEQLGKTAAVVNGLLRGALRSTQRADFSKFGVVDPLQGDPAGEGYGKRVTLRDATGKVLCDLIIGRMVESGVYYVRRPDEDRIYECKLDASGISTRFADWVRTDLLDVTEDKMRSLTLDLYRVDEVTATKVPGEVIALHREDGKWTLDGLRESEELDTEKVGDMTRTLESLTLVGVRRKPEGLVSILERIEKGEKISRREVPKLNSLAAIGYYLGEDPRTGRFQLVSNEGELRLACEDGLTYTLLFGDILYGEPDEISAASAEKTSGEEKKETEAKGAEHRYLFLRAGFDESLIPGKPVKPAEPKPPTETEKEAYRRAKAAWEKEHAKAPKPDDKATEKKEAGAKPETKKPDKPADDKAKPKEPEDPTKRYQEAKKAYEQKLKDYESDLKDYNEKVKKGKEKAEKLKKRFAEWYYVISAEAYKKLHLARKDLVRPKKKEESKKDKKKDTASKAAGEGGGKTAHDADERAK